MDMEHIVVINLSSPFVSLVNNNFMRQQQHT